MRNLPQRAPTFQRFCAVYFQVWAMKPIAALLIVCLMVSAIPVLAMDCREWNSEKYFEAATVEEVAGCLQSGVDPKARGRWGDTPLHWVAGSNENPAVIAALVDAGADPNARDEDGNTPLHVAALAKENPTVISALVEAGGDLKAWDDSGYTPLHVAAGFSENPAVIEALLDAGADPKARDKKGKTPWSYAKGRKQLKGSDAYRRLKEGRL